VTTPTTLDALRLFSRLLLLQARWDPARMQGVGLAFALEPWLSKVWAAEPEALREARARHLDYFNTHPAAAYLLAGVIVRREAQAAAASGAERAALVAKIKTLKTGIGASLAGLYDSFFWGALRPASALAGLLVLQAGYRFGIERPALLACAVALALYNVPSLAARWIGLARGLRDGETAVAELAALPAQAWIRGLRGAAAGGAIAAFAFAAWGLPGGVRVSAVLAFAAGLALTWRGVAPLAQLGLAGLAGMAASASGLAP
jgi:PTS system mannose-specific IID component